MEGDTLTVGIIGQASYVPRPKLDMPGTFAEAKGEDPEKFSEGLGMMASSIPDIYDDPVSMASNAALRLMENYDVEPREVGTLAVGTESGFDTSKPVGNYVLGNLEKVFGEGVLEHVHVPETKSACIGGTWEVDNSINRHLAGRNWGRNDIVINTDVALYRTGDPGEATQGAGATALLIGDTEEDGGLVEHDKYQGKASLDVNDFLKPEMSKYPTVDGKFSLTTYWYAMRSALEGFEESRTPSVTSIEPASISPRQVGGLEDHEALSDYNPVVEDFDRIFYHQPFPDMQGFMGAGGFVHSLRGTEEGEEFLDEVGRVPATPDRRDFNTKEEWKGALVDWWPEKYEQLKRVRDTKPFQRFYQQKVEPATFNNERLGNWYTGSVHESRTSVFDHARAHHIDLGGDRFLVGSYGSGAQAEVHSETVTEDYSHFAEKLNTRDQLEDRRDLTFDEYMALREGKLDSPLTEPRDDTFVWTGEFGDMGERKYAFADEVDPRSVVPEELPYAKSL